MAVEGELDVVVGGLVDLGIAAEVLAEQLACGEGGVSGEFQVGHGGSLGESARQGRGILRAGLRLRGSAVTSFPSGVLVPRRASVLRVDWQTANQRCGIHRSRPEFSMTGSPKKLQKTLQWRLECLGHSLVEILASRLPGPLVFRLGEALGGLVWRFMPLRQKLVLRNLRIVFGGEKDLPELRRMALETFRRSGGNLISAARTAVLPPERLGEVIEIENIGLLEQELARGRGLVLLLSHMGNWEILSRIVHLFPPGSKTGAFYRPLNNPLLDERILRRRQTDGTRMFSKRDNPHHVAAFLREGGIVGILADQRVGMQGELVSFFGRLTRSSPLPGLLARRAKSGVLALSVRTVGAGKWRAEFHAVDLPHRTGNCMLALERAMKSSVLDVFWLQERWKVYLRGGHSITDWLGGEKRGEKPHRVLLWLEGTVASWRLPERWRHPDVEYEVALVAGAGRPDFLPESAVVHRVPASSERAVLRELVAGIDAAAALPVDFVLTNGDAILLAKACKREAIPVFPVS